MSEVPTTIRRRTVWRMMWWPIYALTAAPLVFFGLLPFGMIPVNGDYQPADDPTDSVTVFIIEAPIHTDIVVPIDDPACDWRQYFPADVWGGAESQSTHLAMGWGDRAWYVEKPGVVGKVGNAIQAALLPSDSLMYVQHLESPSPSDKCRKFVISRARYTQLVKFLQGSFRRDPSGGLMRIPGVKLTDHDALFEAVGRYHIFYTCNCWTGTGLKRAGIRVGWWTPVTRSVMWTLPSIEEPSP